MIPEQTQLRKDLKTVYRLGDNPSTQERASLGLGPKEGGTVLASVGMAPNQIGAVYTGEKRPPRKGEWYLSGAVVEAYRAPNDLSTPHAIAHLVRVRDVRKVEIV